MDNIIFRQMKKEEIPTALALRDKLLEEIDVTPVDGVRETLRSFMENGMQEGTVTLWAALADGECAACLALCYYTVLPYNRNPNGKAAYIANVYTRPEYRGQKLASRLTELAIEEARNRQVHEIRLHAALKAVPVYERIGFAMTERDMILRL